MCTMRKTILFVLMLTLAACGRHAAENTGGESAAKDTQRTFPTVKVPEMLPAEDRPAYLVEHYWDRFDFRDTIYCNLPDVTEQAYANFLDLLRYVDPATSQKAIGNLMRSAEADSTMFDYFISLGDKYLYDPNSPFRNDELYIPLLETVIASPLLDEAEKIRPRSQLSMALKNRLGQQATDFTYTLFDGRQGHLYGIEADYLLLFINNPDCPACKAIREEICSSPMLSEMIEKGTMKVLAIYPDEDITAWLNYRHNIPSTWINAYDKQLRMRDDELYDLKAIPSLYLLDRDKRVMLKDCDSVPLLEEVVYYAEQNGSR